jgi:hypothetical protein
MNALSNPPYDSRLRRTVSRGHIAGICQSLGFDYRRVTNIWIEPGQITVEEYSPEAHGLVTTELSVEKGYWA